MVHSCNFRYAGRLSNENARTLTSLHEKFAVNVTSSLEAYLGASLRLRLVSLEQSALQDYLTGMAPSSYLVPCALNVMQSSFLIQMDVSLIYPVIDLLLGGVGTPSQSVKELTDIDEEIMESVNAIILKELDRSWRALNLSLSLGHCIKPASVPQLFPVNEKLVVLLFEMELSGLAGNFKIVLPASFVGYLLRHLKTAQSKKTILRGQPQPSLRQRMLDGQFTVAADIPQVRVLVKDLVDLRPGGILRMKAPVKLPGRLTVEDVEIFEAAPVRSGPWKAAQATARSHEPVWTRE